MLIMASAMTASLLFGQPAPTFTGVTQNGETLALSSLAGSKVCLWFYLGTPKCDSMASAFQTLQSDFTAKNCKVVGCSAGSVEANAALATNLGLDYPLLCDTDLRIASAYDALKGGKATSTRAVAVISADGLLSYYWDAKSFET